MNKINSERFYSVLTTKGAEKLAQASHKGKTVLFKYIAIGDGSGSEYQPEPTQTALKHETYRTELESVFVDPVHANCIVCEHRIPENMGGWTIREVGIFDADDDLIAIGNFPETYKPTLTDHAHRVQVVRLVVQVNSLECVEVRVDNTIAFATREDISHLKMQTMPYLCPVGVPLPWPTDIAPLGWALMKGQSFDRQRYPLLAQAYPNGILPNMSGLAIVGCNETDTVLDYQEDTVKYHGHPYSHVKSTTIGNVSTNTGGAHQHTVNNSTKFVGPRWYDGEFDAISQVSFHGDGHWFHMDVSGAHEHNLYIDAHTHNLDIKKFGAQENRIKNRKFNWIVRMA